MLYILGKFMGRFRHDDYLSDEQLVFCRAVAGSSCPLDETRVQVVGSNNIYWGWERVGVHGYIYIYI